MFIELKVDCKKFMIFTRVLNLRGLPQTMLLAIHWLFFVRKEHQSSGEKKYLKNMAESIFFDMEKASYVITNHSPSSFYFAVKITWLDFYSRPNVQNLLLGYWRRIVQNGRSLDLVTYTTWMDALSGTILLDQAHDMYNETVEEECRPDIFTFETLIYGYLRSRKHMEAEEWLTWMLVDLS